MPKAIVTGGAGFIGSHTADLLIKKGYRVVVIDNLKTGKREYVNPKAKFYKKDIKNRAAIFEIFKKDDIERETKTCRNCFGVSNADERYLLS